MVFNSRRHAGQLLAKELKQRGIKPDLVLGLARGGVVVAAEIASGFKVPLAALVVRKISPPFNPEFAIGAIAAVPGLPGSEPSGESLQPSIFAWWDEDTIRRLKLSPGWKKQQIGDKIIEISNYLTQLNFRKNHMLSRQNLRKIILVDDGAATGATMLAAIGAVRKTSQGLSLAYLPAEKRPMPARQSLALQAPAGGSRERLPSQDRSSGRVRIEPEAPKQDREGIVREVGEWQAKAGAKESPYETKIIVALPVASTDAAAKIKHQADETIILSIDPDFRAVGQYYRRFEQVSWEEVREILKVPRDRVK